MGAIWEVRLFGRCAADCQGTPADLSTYKHWALFACLLLEPGPLTRSTLSDRFWHNDRPGRASLSTALLDIRKTFGRETLHTDAEAVVLADPEMFGVDVLDFMRLFRDAARARDPQAHLRYLEAACELARGPFMPRHDRLNEEAWVRNVRAMIHARVEEAFRLLVDAYAEAGRTRDAAEAATRLQRWSPEPSIQVPPPGTERLVVFPGTFLPGAARRITGIDGATLTQLETLGIAVRSGPRWGLTPEARRVLSERLSVEQLRRLEVRHARYYRDLVAAVVKRGPLEPPLEPHRREGEELNLQAAFYHLITRHPDIRTMHFMEGLRRFGLRSLEERGVAWCEAILEDPTLPSRLRARAGLTSAEFRISLFQYATAVRNLQTVLELPTLGIPEEAVRFMLTVALHHAGEAEAALIQAENLTRSPNPATACEALRFMSEIHRAAGRSEAALDCAERALETYYRNQAHPLQIAEALYQLGEARWRNGLLNDAEAVYLQSLELRLTHEESNGVADCLRGLARIRESQGRLAESWALLEDACRRYREGQKDPSLAATKEQMADIHLRRRDREAAYDALADASHHWKAAGDEKRAHAANRRLAALEP